MKRFALSLALVLAAVAIAEAGILRHRARTVSCGNTAACSQAIPQAPAPVAKPATAGPAAACGASKTTQRTRTLFRGRLGACR